MRYLFCFILFFMIHQQESEDETDSDGDLFATGTKEKLPKSEEDEDSEESDESPNEKPRKVITFF